MKKRKNLSVIIIKVFSVIIDFYDCALVPSTNIFCVDRQLQACLICYLFLLKHLIKYAHTYLDSVQQHQPDFSFKLFSRDLHYALCIFPMIVSMYRLIATARNLNYMKNKK